MEKIKQARALVAATEAKVRDLIEAAAREAQYDELSELVAIAQALKRLGGASTAISNSPSRASSAAAQQPLAVAEPRSPGPKSGKDFPRFERDGDRLVKLGWSKRDRTVYEHKASKDVVEAVAFALAQFPRERAFRMEEALPVQLPDGTEVPSYQPYLVLAWLRDRGAVEKIGKDGYRWTIERFEQSDFQAVWTSTPRRID